MNLKRLALVTVPALFMLAACGADEGGDVKTTASGSSGGTTQGAGSGAGSGVGGFDVDLTTSAATTSGAGGGSVNCSGELPVIIRDFTPSKNNDFEQGNNIDDKNIVTNELGPDKKPVYAGNPTTPTTHGKETFDQWYRDVDGVNIPFKQSLKLVAGENGIYTYDNQAFFPIDNMGFGNEGNDDNGQPHNFGFTTEVHTQFEYKGGEVFTFSGDDDLFAYIDGKLVINLGGIHQAEVAKVELDTLGLVKGEWYTLDLFGAERHVAQSHYRIDTTISCFEVATPE